jgi:hypothetical protein
MPSASQQGRLLDAGKPPKLRGVPPLRSDQWHAYADWVAELEAAVGQERARLCTIPTLAYWYSGWTAGQFVRDRLEPFEAVRQPLLRDTPT